MKQKQQTKALWIVATASPFTHHSPVFTHHPLLITGHSSLITHN